MDNVRLDHQVLVDEFCRISVIGMNTSHFSRCQIDLIGLFLLKKCTNGCLFGQVKLLVCSDNNILHTKPFGPEDSARSLIQPCLDGLLCISCSITILFVVT